MASLVTCYYKVNSKHPHSKYEEWIYNLLNNLSSKTNLIIFTSKDLEKYFSLLINGRSNIKLYFREFKGLPIISNYENIWEDQHQKDEQKNIRTKECYIIWNSKLNFLKEAINLNPFNSDKFIWNDIGSFRNINQIYLLNNYPIYDKISKDKIDIIKVKNGNVEDKEFYNSEVNFSGSIFGGGKDAIIKFHNLFYQMFDKYLENEKFIGCDQQIIASVYCKNKNLFNPIIWDENVVINKNIDRWFYMYYYYSN